uniref:Uncharacterized protein n=1 Tax=Macaca fascicularis TaxID=9541 RepID=A0A7N9D4B4_MACFA
MPVVPATWEAEAGELLEPRRKRPAWVTEQDSVSKKKKNTKVSWAWWRTPIIPVTWEESYGKLLKVSSMSLQ